MKSLLILPFLLLGFSALQAQDTILVRGTMANTGGAAISIDVTLTAGRTPTTNTVSTDSRGGFSTFFIVNTFIRQGTVDVEFVDCKRNAVKKTDYFGPAGGPTFTLDYCPRGSGGGGNPTNCSAFFAVRQAYTGRNNPVPHSVIIYENSKGGLLTYSWDFGDGNSSNNQTPIHTYKGNGPYVLCLAIADTNGCKDTLCDTVRIDTSGMLLKKEGFSITVIHTDEIPTNVETSVQDLSASIFPNPVSGLANIKLTIAESAMVNTRVYDVSGMLVVDETSFAQRGENNLSLNMQSLKPGAYVVKISTTEGQWVESVIKN